MPVYLYLLPINYYLTNKYFPSDFSIKERSQSFNEYIQWQLETHNQHVYFNPFVSVAKSSLSTGSTSYCPESSVLVGGGCNPVNYNDILQFPYKDIDGSYGWHCDNANSTSYAICINKQFSTQNGEQIEVDALYISESIDFSGILSKQTNKYTNK